jgi:hypothetical protein
MKILVLNTKWPTLNELLDSKRAVGKPNSRGRRWNGYDARKQALEQSIAMHARAQSFVYGGSSWTFLYASPMRGDLDNQDGACRKLALDALRKAGLIPNDTKRFVRELRAHWHHKPAPPAVTIIVSAERTLELNEMLQLLRKEAA